MKKNFKAPEIWRRLETSKYGISKSGIDWGILFETHAFWAMIGFLVSFLSRKPSKVWIRWAEELGCTFFFLYQHTTDHSSRSMGKWSESGERDDWQDGWMTNGLSADGRGRKGGCILTFDVARWIWWFSPFSNFQRFCQRKGRGGGGWIFSNFTLNFSFSGQFY